MAFVVAACGSNAHPLADSPPDAPQPVVLDGDRGFAVFEDPTGNTLQEGMLPGSFSVDMPQGGSVVVILPPYVCTEDVPRHECIFSFQISAVRGVTPGDHLTATSGNISDVPGSPDAVVAGCSQAWKPNAETVEAASYSVIVEDPAAGPATIPRLPGMFSQYDVYSNGGMYPIICTPPY